MLNYRTPIPSMLAHFLWETLRMPGCEKNETTYQFATLHEPGYMREYIGGDEIHA